MTRELLAVEHLSAGHGEGVVLDDVSFSLDEGQSLALLGRNGVGKTTLLCTLMGLTRRRAGALRFAGADLTRASPFERAQAGLGWVPQERGIFPSLTVDEHLRVAARSGPWTREKVYEVFPALATRKLNRGHQLSGGEQQMVAIGRALVNNPRLLLLDEPMEGLAPIVVRELESVLVRLVREGHSSVILVEQHARLALGLTDRVLVLDRGRVTHSGASSELAKDPAEQARLLAVAPSAHV